jgi:translation elongation factor EF-1beta
MVKDLLRIVPEDAEFDPGEFRERISGKGITFIVSSTPKFSIPIGFLMY